MSIAQKLTTIAENESKVYDAGKKAEWSEFWDELQNNGKRTEYSYKFKGWTDAMFYPKYDIHVVSSSYMAFYNTGIKNLKQRLIECGVELDVSQATGSAMFAYNYKLEELPLLDLSSAIDATDMFLGCKVLHTIDKVILGRYARCTDWFKYCYKLKNIIIGAETKGERCSDLITMPFNEVFKDIWYDEGYREWQAKLTDSFVSEYAEYIDGIDQNYIETYICFETGEASLYYLDPEYNSEYPISLPSWFIPEDETENVSFYLCSPSYLNDCFSRESIANDIDFRHCPLSRKSIGSVISALSKKASGKTLTLKKSAVNEAFGIDVDDETTWSAEFERLVIRRKNWTIAYI